MVRPAACLWPPNRVIRWAQRSSAPSMSKREKLRQEPWAMPSSTESTIAGPRPRAGAGGRRRSTCSPTPAASRWPRALGGARQVLSVDQDAEAIELARENFRQNGSIRTSTPSRWRTPSSSWRAAARGPPLRPGGVRSAGVREVAAGRRRRRWQGTLPEPRRAGGAGPGGLLVTASCSARVSAEQFDDAVREAAFKTRVELQLVEERRQPPITPSRRSSGGRISSAVTAGRRESRRVGLVETKRRS